ncbi:hypothetical protein GCM10029964_075460 [Kibdelosporangium lantanae]
MTWFFVTDGAPPEPSYDDLLAGRNQPQPHDLMKRLFKELTGTSLAASQELVREKGATRRSHADTPAPGKWAVRGEPRFPSTTLPSLLTKRM